MILYTVREVAAILKVLSVTVQRLCASGELPAAKIGKSWRVEAADLEKWLAGKKESGGPGGKQ